MNHSFKAAIAGILILFAEAISGMPVRGSSPPDFITLPSPGAVGGGWTDAGPNGEYIAGSDPSAAAAFTRKEVRINFNWGMVLPVGGSTAEPYKSFPHDNFCVRWTGKIIPRFNEPYTFIVKADQAVTLTLRDPQTGSTAPLVLSPQASSHTPDYPGEKTLVSKPVPLKSGITYQIVLEYHHPTGNASCTLAWSSPSTPEEIIDPVIDQGLNVATYSSYTWAEILKTQRWYDAGDLDANGDLNKNSGGYLFAEGAEAWDGTYGLSFNGSADLACQFNGKFVVDGNEYDKLTAGGPGYNAATNVTHVLVRVLSKEGNMVLQFNNAFRDAARTVPGITNLHLLRPQAEGSDQPCPDDAVVYPPMRRMAANFTALRWLSIANNPCTGLWKDRTLPTDIEFARGGMFGGSSAAANGGENWEYLIMLANESGRDLYLTTPLTADDDYFRKLALLLHYGSDGVNPYTQPTANPKYPPLNSNLHVYYEVGNEIWNWAFASTQDCRRLAETAVAQKTDEGKIINYDGQANYRRYHALRTVMASKIFREVFGDDAMGARIRPLLEYQYANSQDTALISYDFIDRYFNNGDGQHVPDPHPIRYFVWGSGGAGYYGVGNPLGEQTEIVFKDPSFEQPLLIDGKTSSDPGDWTFSGMSGIYRGLSSAVASYKPDKEIAQPAQTAVGIRFHTGANPIWVYKLGRVYNEGNDEGARIFLLRASDLSVIAKGETGSSNAFVEVPTGYYWAEFPDKKPVQLLPNTDYLLVSQDIKSASQIDGFDTTIVPGLGLTDVKSVQVATVDPANPATWKVTVGEDNHCAGPVTMLYSQSPDLNPAFPQPPEGQQAAYLSGNGEISQDVDFPKAGSYALTFNAIGVGKPYVLDFKILCDDQDASAPSQSSYHSDSPSMQIGGFARNLGFKEEWGSGVFTIDQPGLHKIRIIGTSSATDGSSSVVFDNIRIASVDALMGSGFGGGSALGQPAEAAYGTSQAKDSRFAWSFGLPRVSYETGWSVGGDFSQRPIQNWSKFRDPRAETISDQAIDLIMKAGMRLPVYGVYTYWPEDDFAHGESYPFIRSFIQASEKLPIDADNGVAIPATLTGDNAVEWAWDHKKQVLTSPGSWTTWTIICPATGNYHISAQTTPGGKFVIETDGIQLGPLAEAGTPVDYLVRMTKGIHGIRLANREGSVGFEAITVKTPP
jgi:hypothetical protein